MLYGKIEDGEEEEAEEEVYLLVGVYFPGMACNCVIQRVKKDEERVEKWTGREVLLYRTIFLFSSHTHTHMSICLMFERRTCGFGRRVKFQSKWQLRDQ